ncbi:VLRF1 family aeRF1-type release factor [Tuberibacillus sp. Marseille-P3662]|uniref:VLRF1 family aeRF1-type release factor n=1 Tax=Tuberibacillus sp. Marseille-P3662 TaxID=1965358 RepID=UPI000A1CA3ED|nr:VLRF1 family aeRF1-type release factor [Tuberibacillus sp. Marseille-P3662]
MSLKKDINELMKVNVEEPKKVLTMYLNTDRKSPEQQKGEWKIHLKNGLKNLEEKAKKSGSQKEMDQAKEIIKKVEDIVYGNERELLRGLVLMTTADENIWFMKTLQVPVETAFHWETYPVLDQLQALEKTYPYMGIVLIQKDEAAVLETEMGVLEEQTHYTLDLNTDDWREHQGPQGDDITEGGSKKDEYDERVEAHQQRWFKNLVSEVERKADSSNWEKIYLVGERDEVKALKSYFNKEVDKIISRNLLNRNADKILDAVLD